MWLSRSLFISLRLPVKVALPGAKTVIPLVSLRLVPRVPHSFMFEISVAMFTGITRGVGMT